MIACLWQLWVLEMFCIDSKLETPIRVASRPREGIIPPEQVCCTNIEPHFCPLADPGAIKKEA